MPGPAVPIDYAFDPTIRRFRSQVERARTGPADFNGHYRFVVWGCGTQCTSHVILDLRTGRTYDDTLVDFSCGTVEYRKESGLVIAGPDSVSEEGDDLCATRPRRFLAWSGTGLAELHHERSMTTPASLDSAATVVDSTVTLRLKGGRMIVLVSNPYAEGSSRRYTFDHHLPHTPFFGVDVSYYEAIHYLLFHDSTGNRITLDAKPVESPSGKQLLVMSAGLETDDRANAISVFRVDGDSLIEEWTEAPTEWGPTEPAWSGEDTIHFIRVWPREQRRALPRSLAILVRHGPEWVVEGVVPDTLPDDTTVTH